MPRTNLLGLSAYGWESKIRPNINKIIKIEMAKTSLIARLWPKKLAYRMQLSAAD